MFLLKKIIKNALLASVMLNVKRKMEGLIDGHCTFLYLPCYILLSTFTVFLFSFQENSFKSSQLKNSRVKSAYSNHWNNLQVLLAEKKIDKEAFSIYIRIFKEEGILEVWAKNKSGKQYTLLKIFPVCANSGRCGPKRRQGDGQVPEGFYEITAFQPQSSYHLALKVGYPNKSDLLKASSKDPGGDIMIHGNYVTIGCIPIQDDPIEELYVLCTEAKNTGSVIFADIYPFKFNVKNESLLSNATTDLRQFWNSLKLAYDYLEPKKIVSKNNYRP